ncbi:MAG: Sec-independent protein translocase protein TatB [Sphingomonas sp.]|jgi:sec-independent protein translocase protein TatB
MFDIAPSEFLLVAVVALVVIGPKDLPKAMRVIGYWVGRARGVTRQFREGFDTMMREAELKELEEKWAAENARIMAMHPVTGSAVLPLAEPAPDAAIMLGANPGDESVDGPAQLVAQPHIVPSGHFAATHLSSYVAPPSDDEIAAAEGVPPAPQALPAGDVGASQP